MRGCWHRRKDRYIAVGDFYLTVGVTVLFVEYL